MSMSDFSLPPLRTPETANTSYIDTSATLQHQISEVLILLFSNNHNKSLILYIAKQASLAGSIKNVPLISTTLVIPRTPLALSTTTADNSSASMENNDSPVPMPTDLINTSPDPISKTNPNLNTNRNNVHIAINPLSQFSSSQNTRSSSIFLDSIISRDRLGSFSALYAQSGGKLGISYCLAQVVDDGGDRIMAVNTLKEDSFCQCMVGFETYPKQRKGAFVKIITQGQVEGKRGAMEEVSEVGDIGEIMHVNVPHVLIIETLMMLEMLQMGVRSIEGARNYASAKLIGKARIINEDDNDDSTPYLVNLFTNRNKPRATTMMTKREARNSWSAITTWSSKLLQYQQNHNADIEYVEIREGYGTNFDYIAACDRWFAEKRVTYMKAEADSIASVLSNGNVILDAVILTIAPQLYLNESEFYIPPHNVREILFKGLSEVSKVDLHKMGDIVYGALSVLTKIASVPCVGKIIESNIKDLLNGEGEEFEKKFLLSPLCKSGLTSASFDGDSTEPLYVATEKREDTNDLTFNKIYVNSTSGMNHLRSLAIKFMKYVPKSARMQLLTLTIHHAKARKLGLVDGRVEENRLFSAASGVISQGLLYGIFELSLEFMSESEGNTKNKEHASTEITDLSAAKVTSYFAASFQLFQAIQNEDRRFSKTIQKLHGDIKLYDPSLEKKLTRHLNAYRFSSHSMMGRIRIIRGQIKLCEKLMKVGLQLMPTPEAFQAFVESCTYFKSLKFAWMRCDLLCNKRDVECDKRDVESANYIAESIATLLNYKRGSLIKSAGSQSNLIDVLYFICNSGTSGVNNYIDGYDLVGDEFEDGKLVFTTPGDDANGDSTTANTMKKEVAQPGSVSLYFDGSSICGLAGAVFKSDHVMKGISTCLVILYSSVQSVEDQHVDEDPFEKFLVRLKIMRILRAITAHPNLKAGAEAIHSDKAQLLKFVESICSNALSIFLFLRDNGIDGLVAAIRERGGNVNDRIIITVVETMKNSLYLFTQTILFLCYMVEDECVMTLIVDSSDELKRKLATAVVKCLETLFLTIPNPDIKSLTETISLWSAVKLQGSQCTLITLLARIMNATFTDDKIMNFAASSIVFDLNISFANDDEDSDVSFKSTFSDIQEAFEPLSEVFGVMAERAEVLHLQDFAQNKQRQDLLKKERELFLENGSDIASYANEQCSEEGTLQRMFMSMQDDDGKNIEEVGMIPGFKFHDKARKAEVTSMRAKELMKGWRKIQKYLDGSPMKNENFIRIKVLESDASCARIMLTSNESGPYAFGVFQFDVWLPLNYPSVPPMIEILTTGNGTTMMSPNLYADGKVCTALLNNESSNYKNEKWTAESHLGQVLMAIQAQLLVDHPGSMKWLRDDSEESLAYTKEKRYDTVKWAICDVLKHRNTPGCIFAKAIYTHFKCCSMVVKAKLLTWMDEEVDLGRKRKLERVVVEVFRLLDDLCDEE